MAKATTRPALAGNSDKPGTDEAARAEIVARDEAAADTPEIETLPADGASDAARGDAPDGSGEAEPAKPKFETDDARSAIIAKYTANRDDLVVDEEEEAATAAEAVEAAAAAAPAPAPAPKPKPAPKADDPLHRIKVDGVEIELPLSDIIAKAQMNLAADSRLREANELLDRAKATATPRRETGEQVDQPADRIAAQQPRQTAERKTKRDPAEMLPLVDSLQAGSPEEAAEQLAALLDTVDEHRAQDQAPVAETARAVVLHERAQEDVQRAIEATREKFPDLETLDSDLADLLVRKTVNTVAAALKGIGYTDKELAMPVGDLLTGYARIRRDPTFADGRKLKPIQDIFQSVTGDFHAKFVAPKPPTSEAPADSPGRVVVSPERAARKTTAQPQPRTASVRTDMTGVGQAKKPPTASEVVQKMAQARGQASAA